MSNQNTIATPSEPTKVTPTPSPASWNSKKLQPHHLQRSAIVYVRQSSPQQVLDHQESTARQYALVDFAVQLGWSPSQVQVIDEDQGHSGATAEGRHGFHRLLAEVGLDQVGIILGIELSRLARSNKIGTNLSNSAASFVRCSPIKTGCTIQLTTTIACCSVCVG